jgi:hypothetical protein
MEAATSSFLGRARAGRRGPAGRAEPAPIAPEVVEPPPAAEVPPVDLDSIRADSAVYDSCGTRRNDAAAARAVSIRLPAPQVD